MTPTNCYLVSLAISDCLFFVAAGPSEIMMLNTPMGVYVFGSSACSALSYLSYLAINASSKSAAVISISFHFDQIICGAVAQRKSSIVPAFLLYTMFRFVDNGLHRRALHWYLPSDKS